MKHVVNISLGASQDNYETQTTFMGQSFLLRHFGTDGNFEKAADLLLRWNKNADSIGLGSIKFPYTIGSDEMVPEPIRRLCKMGEQMHTPVTTGQMLRTVSQEWAIRHIQFTLGNNYFDNSRVFFFSGMVGSTLAGVLSEFTDNLLFADPILKNGIPRLLRGIKDLELYAHKYHGLLKWVPSKSIAAKSEVVQRWNERILSKAIQRSFIVVVPYYDFHRYLGYCAKGDLKDKIIITSTAYDDRIEFLQKQGVETIIDTTPKILERVLGLSMLEAMILAALEVGPRQIRSDDLLEVICEQRMKPRLIYSGGEPVRKNRFAFVIHPFSQQYLKRFKPIEAISVLTPQRMMNTIEKLVAYSPPIVFSKVTGIESPTGTQAEGWILSLGITSEEMKHHNTEFVARRLLLAAEKAKRLGAQILGIGILPKDLVNAAVTAAKHSEIPVTTGNSYVASSALWAAADAVRRMGLIETDENKILQGRTMVVGATGAVGQICCRLLAKAFREVHMVSRNMAKLMALQESIQEESPRVKISISTRADKYLKDMDVIVAASHGARRDLDLMQVKPGCVITDITRPLLFSSEEVEKRPDVLVIRGGEIELPGKKVEMKDLGLPKRAVYAGLAETIILALEGRFEDYTVGTDTKWEKVREIYRLGLKHGMKLSAIAGVDGVYTESDFERVRHHALEARKKMEDPKEPGIPEA